MALSAMVSAPEYGICQVDADLLDEVGHCQQIQFRTGGLGVGRRMCVHQHSEACRMRHPRSWELAVEAVRP